MNRPKDIGTGAETLVKNYALSRGVHAERRALAGALDQGDLWLGGGRVVVEVKARKTHATAKQIHVWMVELDREVAAAAKVQPAVEIGALVFKGPGAGAAKVADWHVHLRVDDLLWLLTGTWEAMGATAPGPVQIRLSHLIDGLIARGMTTETPTARSTR